MHEPRGGWGIVAVFLMLGAAVMVAYVHVTPFDTRTHDIGGQMGYLDAVRVHGIPSDTDCWECHQPPAYYEIAAGVLSVLKLQRPKNHASPPDNGPGARALQGLAAALGIGTLACWLLTIRLALTTPYERILASGLATFWPTLAIEGCKVGNDALICLLASASIWQLVSWRRTGRSASLIGAAVFAGMAANAKANGLVVAVLVVVSIGLFVLRPQPGARRWPRGATPAAAALASLLGLWVFVLGHYKRWTTHPDFTSIGAHLGVKNTWADFLVISPSTFGDDPWVRFVASSARDEFWNYLLRSSLYGEYGSTNPVTKTYAYALLMLALAFAPFVVAGLVACVVRGMRPDDTGHRELALALLGFLAFLVALRLRFPYSVHNDFRFVLPIVLPCAVMAALALGRFRRRFARRWPHVAALPGLLLVAFCFVSVHITVLWK